MANNSQNGNQQKGTYNPNQFNPQSLANGLIEDVPIALNLCGISFREKTSILESKLEELIAVSMEISEIDHVAIKPKLTRDGGLQTVLCRAYFDTSDVTSGHITRKGTSGGVAGSGVRTIVPLVGGGSVIGSGDFEVSDHFKKKFAPLTLTDDGRLDIGSLPKNKDIAVLDLDFMALMTVALGIKSDSPYNFSIVAATPIGNAGDDFLLLINKYIDTQKKRGRHKRGGKTNYHDLDREWAKQNDAYYKNSNRRSF